MNDKPFELKNRPARPRYFVARYLRENLAWEVLPRLNSVRRAEAIAKMVEIRQAHPERCYRVVRNEPFEVIEELCCGSCGRKKTNQELFS